jgi:hypothetical protein
LHIILNNIDFSSNYISEIYFSNNTDILYPKSE